MKLSSMKLIKLLLMLSALSPGALPPAYGMEEKELWREQGARPEKTEKEAAHGRFVNAVSCWFHDKMKCSVLALVIKRQYLPDSAIFAGPSKSELEKKAKSYFEIMGRIKKSYPNKEREFCHSTLEKSLIREYVNRLCHRDRQGLIEATLEEPFSCDEKGRKFYKENEENFKELEKLILSSAKEEQKKGTEFEVPETDFEALKSTRALVVAALKLGIAKKDYDNHKDKKEEISPFVEKYRGEFVAAEQNLKKDVEAFIENRLTDATPKDQRPTPSSPGGAHAF